MKNGLIQLDRRHLLRGASALTAAAALGVAPNVSHARVDLPAPTTPYFYRFAIGDARATMVSDGPLPIGPAADNFSNVTPEQIGAVFAANFLSPDSIVLEQNVLVVTLGGRTMLFDTGLGTIPGYGPGPGHLMETLLQAGIDPAGIDAVVLSHAHLDHVAGIMTDDGERHFPNAQYYVSQADFDFWTDEANPVASSRDAARKHLLPNRDRVIFVKDGEEFLPGVTAIHTPGHTVGHMMYMISSGDEQLCYIGDLAHHVLLVEHPLIEFNYDTDAKQSAETRNRMLGMFADEKIPVLAYHFAWPGIGHIARSGDGFRYVPKPMRLLPAA